MVKKKKKEYRDGIAGCAFVIDAVSNGDNGENRQNQPRRRPSHLPISSLSLSLSLSQVSSLESKLRTTTSRVLATIFSHLPVFFSFFPVLGLGLDAGPFPN